MGRVCGWPVLVLSSRVSMTRKTVCSWTGLGLHSSKTSAIHVTPPFWNLALNIWCHGLLFSS